MATDGNDGKLLPEFETKLETQTHFIGYSNHREEQELATCDTDIVNDKESIAIAVHITVCNPYI